jgi:hypothetical protein
MRTRAAVLIPLAAVTAACGARTAAPSLPSAPAPLRGELLLLRPGSGPTVALAGGVRRTLPAGQPAGGGRLLTATAQGTATLVAAVDVRSGRTLATRRLAGRWTFPATVAGGPPDALSPSGATVVLARTDGSGSRFVLLDASLRGAARTIALPPGFSFDAMAPEAGLLYLVERRSATRYAVRVYDLNTGGLRPGELVDKREPEEKLQGLSTSRATSPDGTWVYTLYRRANEAPFIHALNVAEGYALCVDLPVARRDAAEWGLTLSADGATLYAANPALGKVLAIATEGVPEVRRSAAIPAAATGTTPRPALGASLYVPSANGILALDPETLSVQRRLLAGHRVTAVVASGPRLYAQDGGAAPYGLAPLSRNRPGGDSRGGIVALDPRSGRVLRRIGPPAAPAALSAVLG